MSRKERHALRRYGERVHFCRRFVEMITWEIVMVPSYSKLEFDEELGVTRLDLL